MKLNELIYVMLLSNELNRRHMDPKLDLYDRKGDELFFNKEMLIDIANNLAEVFDEKAKNDIINAIGEINNGRDSKPESKNEY